MTHIRISYDFFKVLKKKQKRGERIERTILNQMHPIDRKLELIFRDQDERRRKSKFKKK